MVVSKSLIPQSSKREVSDHIWTPLSVVKLIASVLKAQDHDVRLNVRKACACPFTIIELYLGAFHLISCFFNPLHCRPLWGYKGVIPILVLHTKRWEGFGGVMRATECILWHVIGEGRFDILWEGEIILGILRWPPFVELRGLLTCCWPTLRYCLMSSMFLHVTMYPSAAHAASLEVPLLYNLEGSSVSSLCILLGCFVPFLNLVKTFFNKKEFSLLLSRGFQEWHSAASLCFWWWKDSCILSFFMY